tara:strand:- start:11 stop:238 length:228 start_codon:yes stop_codon:yes gene_type:complete
MKAKLEFNLPEDNDEFKLATQGNAMYSVLWEMDQWLRGNTKHAPDTMSNDTYKAYETCRNKLGEIMSESNIFFDL